ncbi:MAG TPA: hypothetical protein VH350_06625 [Candidatus Sulfotelmatobacter sp.]|nr:hypothetical protein [Candidatus Sulfotelmatobacter sp.]
MPAAVQPVPSLDVFVTRLHEAHEVSVYEAIERLVQAGGAVGLDEGALLRMLDRGMTFEALLEVIESRMECSQRVA